MWRENKLFKFMLGRIHELRNVKLGIIIVKFYPFFTSLESGKNNSTTEPSPTIIMSIKLKLYAIYKQLQYLKFHYQHQLLHSLIVA